MQAQDFINMTGQHPENMFGSDWKNIIQDWKCGSITAAELQEQMEQERIDVEQEARQDDKHEAALAHADRISEALIG